MKLIRYAALIGDAMYILWIAYNAIDDGFQDIGTIRGLVPMGLVVLLLLNLVLLWRRDATTIA